MPFLSELLTPTFLVFLGILLLVVSLAVVYFESKLRDQNHKIASMLSLVSTLAEDMNGVKMGLNQVAMYQMGGSVTQPKTQPLENSDRSMFLHENDNLIPVSDDDSDENTEGAIDDETSINDSDIDADSLSDDSDDETDDSDDETERDVKVLRLNIQEVSDNSVDEVEDVEEVEEVEEFDELEEVDDVDDFEEVDELEEAIDEDLSVSSKTSSIYQLEMSSTENAPVEKSNNPLNLSVSDLKTINISLEETVPEPVDYKKLALPKLRTIVVEKGLVADATKLKKNELLKLLEVE
jgi:hypothetical protein